MSDLVIDRAARRRLARLEKKAGQSFAAWDEFMGEVARYSDETVPLTYTGGYVHRLCGAEAERPSNYAAGAYCKGCGRAVPWEETEPVRRGA